MRPRLLNPLIRRNFSEQKKLPKTGFFGTILSKILPKSFYQAVSPKVQKQITKTAIDLSSLIKPALHKLANAAEDVVDYYYENLDPDPFADNMKKVTAYFDHRAPEDSIILGSSNPLLVPHNLLKNAGAAAMFSPTDIYTKKREPGQEQGNTMRYYSSRSGRGIEVLREALFSYCGSNGFDTRKIDFVVTHSIPGSLLPNLCDGVMRKGDKILLTIPTFGPFYSLFKRRRFDIKPTRLNEESRWKLTPAILEEMLAQNHDAKLFVFINPGNPMGESYSKDELSRLADVFVEHNQHRPENDKLIVFSDEVAKNSVINKTNKFVSIGSLPGMEDFTVTAWSLSKDQGPGLGVAIGIGSEELTSKIRTGEGPPYPMQCAAAEVYLDKNQETLKEYYEKSNEIYRNNLGLVTSSVNSLNNTLKQSLFLDPHIEIVSSDSIPEGGFQFTFNAKGLLGLRFPDSYSHITDPDQKEIRNSLDLAYYLRETAKVELVPGEGFGFDGEEMKFRITISKREAQLERAFTEISKSLLKLTAPVREIDEEDLSLDHISLEEIAESPTTSPKETASSNLLEKKMSEKTHS